MPWLILILSVPFFGYGALNIFVPRVTFAWQVRSTARHDESDLRSTVGKAFQGWLGIDPESPPTDRVLRRLRWIGLVEMVIALAICVPAFYAISN